MAGTSRAAAELVLEVSASKRPEQSSVFGHREVFCHRSSTSLGRRVARTFLQEESCRKATSLHDEKAESSDRQGFQHQCLPSQREFTSEKFVVRHSLLNLLTVGEKSHIAFVASSVIIMLETVPTYLLPTYLPLCSAPLLGQ